MGFIVGLEKAALAIKAIDKVVDMYPDFEQKQKLKWKNLRAEYEKELVKPKYSTFKTPDENKLARSEDRLLNLRDECLRYGQTLLHQMG